MRKAITLALALAAPAAAAPARPAPPPPFDVRLDVPQDNGPQTVNTLTRTFPVGGASGWHVHPGTEVAYLLSGAMELRSANALPRRMRVGDHFVMPRGIAHNGINVGRVPAMVVITYVVDSGAPVRSAVPDPVTPQRPTSP